MKILTCSLLALLAGCIVDAAPPARPAGPELLPPPPAPHADSLAAAQAQDIYERQQWEAAQKVARWELAAKKLQEQREAQAKADAKATADPPLSPLPKEIAKPKGKAWEETKPAAPIKRYDATTLTRRFVSNQVAALAELEDKEIEVTGVVVGVEDGVVGMAGHARGHFVSCELADDVEVKEVAHLARGRRAVLRGTVSEVRKNDWRTRFQEWVVMTKCRVKR
jgi:hypothetical protein